MFARVKTCATHFTIASQCGADLFYDVSCQACLIAIDFWNGAFEFNDDFAGIERGNLFAQVYTKRCSLIVE